MSKKFFSINREIFSSSNYSKIRSNCRNKKASISPALLIMFFLVIVLLFGCLFYFIVRKSSLYENVIIPNSVDAVYTDQAVLNDNVQEIIDNSLKGYNPSMGKQVFMDNLKKELGLYQEYYAYSSKYMSAIANVESQVTEKNIELNEDKISITLNLFVAEAHTVGGKEVIRVEYPYTKTFEKTFN